MNRLIRRKVIIWSGVTVLLSFTVMSWADTTASIQVTTTTATSITATELGVGNSQNPCDGASCMTVGDDNTCNTAGVDGNSYTNWTVGTFTVAAGTTTTYHLSIVNGGSAGNLAHMLCPSGTIACHVCVCGGPTNITSSNAGASTASSGFLTPVCTSTGVVASVNSTLTLTFP